MGTVHWGYHMHGRPLLTHCPVGSFFCTGSAKQANLVTLVSWYHMCWSLTAAASIPRSIHQQAMMVMSLDAKRSLNR